MDFDNISLLKNKMYATSENMSKCYCSSNSLDYYHEMEGYKSKLKEAHNLINKQETELSLLKEQYRKEVLKLNDDISKYKEKFERLHDSHKRISRLNHDLEERTLTIVEKFNDEKTDLEASLKDLSSKYEASQAFMNELQGECERYRQDCMVAVQLLQNNPGQFFTRNIDSLPADLQDRLAHLQRDIDISHSFGLRPGTEAVAKTTSSSQFVPLSTYPPTTMVFSEAARARRGDASGQVCPSRLAELLHPDKDLGRCSCRGRVTVEVVCTVCGRVSERRDAGVQTAAVEGPCPPSVSQTRARRAQNLVFDV